MLVDTNIFLEILMNQEKKEKCKKFLDKNSNKIYLSDFSLHSIGVILFRNNKKDIFIDFINDIIPNIDLLSLNKQDYELVNLNATKYNLNFDDSYQCAIADKFELEIVTMDKDFKKVEKDIKINFI